MTNDIPTRLLVVSNADAGTNDEAAVDAARAVWEAAGREVRVVATAGPDELADLLRDVDDELVVAAGGDGSLHAVVQALADVERLDRVPVGLLPLGTGNDMARGLGLSLEPEDAANDLLVGSLHGMDLLVDQDGRIGMNAVNIGIGAAASQRATSLKKGMGPAAYPVGAVAAGATEPGWTLTITVDDEVVVDAQPVLHVVIGNGPSVGGGTAAAPGADPEDHRAEVVVSLATSAMARIGYATDLRRGEHVDRDDVLAVGGREIVVEGDEHPWNVDGELPPERTRSHWVLHSAAWHLVHPGRPSDV
ncbi:diacylglycerol/lipid kinase family protein [Salsipaludibacter albus]|uniref:diacylglycerol/lipid kinase family protein n=1 Tax=Salsipaludibacter albus TaxID=2849650 RepID=UPI001EE49A05|nr:diacylglycerol kinase family protein [Salsipaludibacter albus]MBY5162352.1 lipid kinase [Salsipaludibacter albus]